MTYPYRGYEIHQPIYGKEFYTVEHENSEFTFTSWEEAFAFVEEITGGKNL